MLLHKVNKPVDLSFWEKFLQIFMTLVSCVSFRLARESTIIEGSFVYIIPLMIQFLGRSKKIAESIDLALQNVKLQSATLQNPIYDGKESCAIFNCLFADGWQNEAMKKLVCFLIVCSIIVNII